MMPDLILQATTCWNQEALAFHPVDGGSGRACRGASTTDSSPDYYVA